MLLGFLNEKQLPEDYDIIRIQGPDMGTLMIPHIGFGKFSDLGKASFCERIRLANIILTCIFILVQLFYRHLPGCSFYGYFCDFET